MSIIFLLAIMLIALMFSMYESEGVFEGATGGRNATQNQLIQGVTTSVNTLNTNVNTLNQSVSNLDTRTTSLGTRTDDIENRVDALETPGQAQKATSYNNGPVVV